MALQISNPFLYIAGLDGEALEDGKIYIGTEGFDARTNQVAAFFDDALTVSATQPIRTMSGYPVNGVNAAQVFTASAYSISVYTSNDVLVFSSLSENTGLATNAAAIASNASDIATNTAAINNLGSAADADLTDNDDLTVDPDNIGTRGNAAAFSAAQIAAARPIAISALQTQSLSDDDGNVAVEIASSVTVPAGDYLVEVPVQMVLGLSGGTSGEAIFGNALLSVTNDADDTSLTEVNSNLRTVERVYFTDSASDLSTIGEAIITGSFTIASDTDVDFTITFSVGAITDTGQDIFFTTRYIKLTPIRVLS